mmetsp:Transcript_19439/g.29883  ORF Transcript_19439/g.29883 Transcript_19439/m.29883 type:complete len:89 (-) Transcript_19439:136-402(-)
MTAECIFRDDFFDLKCVEPLYVPENREENMKKLVNDDIPVFLKRLEKLLEPDSKFICGNEVTIYDFQVGGFFSNTIFNPKNLDPELWK